MSKEEVKTESKKEVQKKLNLSELSAELSKDESKFPFKNWDLNTNADMIVEIESIEGKNFTCIAYNRKTKKQENVKLSIPSALDKQFTTFELEEDINAGKKPRVHILYLGKKPSRTNEGNEFHSFVAKFWNETLGCFQTTNQYLSWKEQEASK